MSKSITKYIMESLTDLIEHIKTTSADQLLSECNNMIRKVAHACIFFLLGILLYFGFRPFLKKKVWVYLSALSGLAVTAALDEIHQFFVQGRGPMVADVVLDICGGAAGLLLIFLLQWVGGLLMRHEEPNPLPRGPDEPNG